MATTDQFWTVTTWGSVDATYADKAQAQAHADWVNRRFHEQDQEDAAESDPFGTAVAASPLFEEFAKVQPLHYNTEVPESREYWLVNPYKGAVRKSSHWSTTEEFDEFLKRNEDYFLTEEEATANLDKAKARAEQRSEVERWFAEEYNRLNEQREAKLAEVATTK